MSTSIFITLKLTACTSKTTGGAFLSAEATESISVGSEHTGVRSQAPSLLLCTGKSRGTEASGSGAPLPLAVRSWENSPTFHRTSNNQQKRQSGEWMRQVVVMCSAYRAYPAYFISILQRMKCDDACETGILSSRGQVVCWFSC